MQYNQENRVPDGVEPGGQWKDTYVYNLDPTMPMTTYEKLWSAILCGLPLLLDTYRMASMQIVYVVNGTAWSPKGKRRWLP